MKTLKPLDLSAVPFDRVPVSRSGSHGTPDTSWVPSGMPQLGKYKWILDIVFFLYENRKDAEAGVNSGGTGFLVGLPSSRWADEVNHIHAITNYHVAVLNKNAPPFPVIRINCQSGPPEIFDYDPSEWLFAPRSPDIAISPPLALNPLIHKAQAAHINRRFDSAILA